MAKTRLASSANAKGMWKDGEGRDAGGILPSRTSCGSSRSRGTSNRGATAHTYGDAETGRSFIDSPTGQGSALQFPASGSSQSSQGVPAAGIRFVSECHIHAVFFPSPLR